MFQEIKIQNALEKEIQPDNSTVITIDAYDGCQLQCPYCFQLSKGAWSRNIFIRTNIADVLEEQLRSLKDDNTELYIGSLSDPYMDIEKEYRLTRSLLEVLKDKNVQVYITTKEVNQLILRDLELLKSFRVPPVVSIGLSHIGQAHKGAAHPNIHIANLLYEAGIPVKVFITPVLPYIMNIDGMISAINPEIEIYLDKLRVFKKGNQASKVYDWVKREYPTYTEQYFKILFEKDENYYFDLVQKYQTHEKIFFMSELWDEKYNL